MKNSIVTKIILLLLSIVMIASALTLTGCPLNTLKAVDTIDDNYRTFYQIFVGSYSDGDGDGTGDLKGIIKRINYLNDGDTTGGKDLGVQGIWLSPIFDANTYHKYDTKDYYSIDSKFGTMDDLKELIKLCHERNVKIILDLVINHTSNGHPWFREFVKARQMGDTENKYYDYYTCVKSSEKESGKIYYQVPNTQYYYEGNFSSEMPELNYDNEDVRQDMLDVAKYYLDMGIDGFRFDAVKYIYYKDTERSSAFWDWYMGELRKDHPDIYVIGECWSPESEVMEYYSAMNCFNFDMSMAGANQGMVAYTSKGKNSMYSFACYIERYQKKILAENPNGMMISFLANHDTDRIAGTFTNENLMKMAANLYLLCSGSPVIYYGEEIGMRGSRGSSNSDANRRLAMLWGEAGEYVTDPSEASYPQSAQIKTTVKTQQRDENSLFSHYQRVISIRHKYPAIARGEYKALDLSEKNFGGFHITYQGEDLVLLHNTSTGAVTYDLSKIAELCGMSVLEICDYVGVSTASVEGTTITVGPHTSVILK